MKQRNAVPSEPQPTYNQHPQYEEWKNICPNCRSRNTTHVNGRAEEFNVILRCTDCQFTFSLEQAFKAEQQRQLRIVHYIRAWAGPNTKEERPICGAAATATYSVNRTVIGNKNYSDGRPMIICPDCIAIASDECKRCGHSVTLHIGATGCHGHFSTGTLPRGHDGEYCPCGGFEKAG